MLPLSPSLLPSLAAACLYAAATLYQSIRLRQGAKVDKRLLCLLGGFAVVLYATQIATALDDALDSPFNEEIIAGDADYSERLFGQFPEDRVGFMTNGHNRK